MNTASFFTYTGPGRISIARFPPRRTPRGYRVFRALAPGPWFSSVGREEYVKRYSAEVLARLDPQATWDALVGLAGEAEPVLLCWERPPFSDANWCHRRMVAAWFAETLGMDVPELAPAL